MTRPRARRDHGCFLCPLPIQAGQVYLRWGWQDDGTVRTMRVHPACEEYAQSEIPGWTDGDGVEEDAVQMYLKERLLAWSQATVMGVDPDELAKVRATWPELAELVDLVVRDIEEEVREDLGEDSP